MYDIIKIMCSEQLPTHEIYDAYPYIRNQLIRCWDLVNKILDNQRVKWDEDKLTGFKRRNFTRDNGKSQFRISQTQKNDIPHEIDLLFTGTGLVTSMSVSYFSDEFNPDPGFTCISIDLPIGKRGGVKNISFQPSIIYDEETPYIKLVDWIEQRLE